MNLRQLLKARDRKKYLSHIKNLVALAWADGTLDETELKMISKIGINAGLTFEDIERIHERPDSIDFALPKDYAERLEELYELVLVMMANSQVHEKEYELCKHIAARLQFKEDAIDRILTQLMDIAERGVDFNAELPRLLETAEV